MEDTAQSPLAFKIMVFLEKVPSWLKKGPWSPVAHLVIVAFLGYILLTYEYAVASHAEIYDVHSIHFAQNRQAQLGSKTWLQCYRLIGGVYMITITAFVVYMSGLWPLTSYTITSWNLATIRLLASFIGALNFGFSPHFQFVAGNDWKTILKAILDIQSNKVIICESIVLRRCRPTSSPYWLLYNSHSLVDSPCSGHKCVHARWGGKEKVCCI
jgi:hypothetical protein